MDAFLLCPGVGTPGTIWTRAQVEARLIAVFRQMPSCPVFSTGQRIRTTEAKRTPLTEVLEWAQLLDGDPDGKTYLWAWASNRARGDSFSGYCLDMDWNRRTAERGRRRAADALAAILSSAPPSRLLDRVKTGDGASPRAA